MAILYICVNTNIIMKKLLLFILGVVFCGSLLHAQTDFYSRVKTLIKQTHPELTLDNKLLAINVWQIDDETSRECNKNFEKVYNVYRVARLKGGLKGVVVVAVSLDNLSPTATIAMNKDGVVNTLTFKAEDVESGLDFKNVVFDSSGNEVYKDLRPSVVFSSIQQLITR